MRKQKKQQDIQEWIGQSDTQDMQEWMNKTGEWLGVEDEDDEIDEAPQKKQKGLLGIGKKSSKKTPQKNNKSKEKPVKTEKDKKKPQIRTNVVPYTRVYPDYDMIQDGNMYSVAYRIGDMNVEASVATPSEELQSSVLALINGFNDKISFQMFALNQESNKEEYLKQYAVTVDDEYTQIKERYNKLIDTYSEVGSNFVNKSRYFIIRTEKEDVEAAVKCLSSLEERIKELFDGISEIQIEKISVKERLRLMYDLYNPGAGQFGKRFKSDYESLDLNTIKTTKGVTTKNLVAPTTIKEEKTHIFLNEKMYVRTFFVNNIPSILSDNLVSDLRDVSSTMAYSVLYEPLSSEYGYKTVLKRIKQNTVVDTHRDLSNISARKSGKIIKQEHMLQNTEQTYFEQAAMDMIDGAKERGEKIYLTAIAIALYAPDLERLNEDSERLYSCASKYSFQIKCLDFQQINGMKTLMPLANTYIDTFRCLTADKAATLLPLDASDAIKDEGMFFGLNAINDNLIMLNRKNNYQVSGLISGVRHAGKSYSVKREVANTLLSNEDYVFIITNKPEYNQFGEYFGASVFNGATYDIFTMPDEYGVTMDATELKSHFLSSLFATNLYSHSKFSQGDARERVEKELREEVSLLLNRVKEGQPFNPEEYPNIYRSLTGYGRKPLSTAYITGGEQTLNISRLNIFNAPTAADMAIVMDMVWNTQIELLRNDIHSWVYIDCVDSILSTREGEVWIPELMKLSNEVFNPLTIVINNSASFTNNGNIYGQKAMQSILSTCGYVKLLNEGPVERKFYTENLNIPMSLHSYFSNVDIGCGLIITPFGCIPFDDYFHDEEDVYYEIF